MCIRDSPEIGAIYKGKVTRLMNFGAFVEIAPGKEGLVHISKLDTKRCLLYTSSVCLTHLPIGTLPVKKGFLKIRRFSGIPNKK